MDYARRARWQATAQTWLAKAVARTRGDASEAQGEVRWAIGYLSLSLFNATVEAASDLASVLNEEDLEQAARDTQDLAKRLRDRALAVKLGRVEGRTPEEAEAFTRKARELASR